jgi:hypothetical protein
MLSLLTFTVILFVYENRNKTANKRENLIRKFYRDFIPYFEQKDSVVI